MDKRIWIFGTMGLSALIGCNTTVDTTNNGVDALDELDEIALSDTGSYDEAEYDLTWDDPLFRPDIDRWAPNGYAIDIPLGTSNANDIDYAMYRGQSNGDKLGMSAVPTGDLDGDGFNDILMGSSYKSGTGGGDGAAYMVGSSHSSGTQNVKTASSARFYGESTSIAGEALGAGGDVDGDGTLDYVMGGRGYDDADEPWKVNSGVAYVVSGDTADRKLLPSGTMAEIRGAKAYDFVGAGVDIVGDIDGDGFADILVGATGADDNGSTSGAAYLFNGPVTADTTTASADATIGGESSGDSMGSRIRGIGDWDGDGFDDFAIGVRTEDTNGSNAGAVYVITSSTMPSTLADADIIMRGKQADSNLGNAISEAGDIDNDGVDDLLIGALGHGGKGAAYMVLGNSVQGTEAHIGEQSAQTFMAQLAGDQFGSSIAAGDVNADATTDILVGSNRQGSSDKGAVYGFYGPFTGGSAISATSADFKINGGSNGDYFGSALDYASNIDATQRNFVVVGASARGSSDYGAVYLFRVD